MNVTVHVAGPLRAAVEGRRKVDLGLPSSADVGDMLQALFALYPKLTQHVLNERKFKTDRDRVELRLLFDGQPGEVIRLREGVRVYLVADQPHRLTDPQGGGV